MTAHLPIEAITKSNKKGIWVSKRKDVISAFLGFLAIWVYANQTRHPHWI